VKTAPLKILPERELKRISSDYIEKYHPSRGEGKTVAEDKTRANE
jgi:vacuolar-type H+-ATPase subunit B/Vma2